MLLLIFAATIPAAADELQNDLLIIDKSLWKAWGEGRGDVFRKHLTEDHVQVVASSGITVGREAIASDVDKGACTLDSFEFSDDKLRRLTEDVVVLSFKATQVAACGDNKLPPKVYGTSIYVRRNGKWMSASYQETPID